MAAARTLVPIMADCTQPGQNEDLKKKYGIRGFPTVMFLDSNGEKVDDLRSRDASGVRSQIEQVVQQHSRPVVAPATLEEGLTRAREQRKLLAVAFMDEGPEAGAFLDLVLAQPMEAMRDRFTWIRRPATGERNRATDEAKEHGVRKSPTLVILDPWAEGEDRQMKKVGAPFRSLPRDLEKALQEAEKRGHPPAEGAPPATPPGE